MTWFTLSISPTSSLSPFHTPDVHWDATEALLQHGLDSCLQHVDPGDYPLLLAENTFSSAEHKEKVSNAYCRHLLLVYVCPCYLCPSSLLCVSLFRVSVFMNQSIYMWKSVLVCC